VTELKSLSGMPDREVLKERAQGIQRGGCGLSCGRTRFAMVMGIAELECHGNPE
jgi:hypothetical protein